MALLALLALALPASAAACGEEGEEDTGPLITEAHLTPGNLPHEGGTGVISARVEDDCGVQQVYAEISSTEGFYTSFELLPFEDINTNARVYRGEFQVPANWQEWSVGYQVSIHAEDTNGAFEEAYAGEIDVEGVPPFDEAPIVGETSVTPRQLSASGGPVTIRARATDARGVSEAFATITQIGSGETFQVQMEPVDFDVFEGVFEAPANSGTEPANYLVEVTALDDIGQPASANAGRISVAAPASPACTGAGAAITGSNSAIQRKAQQLWASAFSNALCPGAVAPRFHLRAAGSQADVIGTEAAPTPTQITALTGEDGAKLAVVPVAQTSIAIVAHPPAECSITKITNRELEQVFSGQLQRWSELLTASGPHCNREITRVVPSVGVGISSQFKSYLARMNGKPLPCIGETWNELRAIEDAGTGAPNTTWPEGCLGVSPIVRPGSIDGAVPSTVNRTGSSIGFAALPEAEEKHSTILALENDGPRTFTNKAAALGAGYANPTAGGMANCGGIEYNVPVGARRKPGESGLNADWSKVVGADPAAGGTRYPLCMLTYALAFHGYSLRPDRAISWARAQTVRDYLRELIVSPSGQALLSGPGSWYAPLPTTAYSSKDVLAAAQYAAGKISY
ncbi:MAG TPA: substrate-binding domain-containing protein [Solirubrobacterales bacterium]|nr:substrate-binding domain-containing protein [Solirubrobacterales bacterium]